MNPYPQHPPAKNFVVHESVHYDNKPGYTGMKRCVILYEAMLWRNGESMDAPPSPESISYWIDTLQQLNFDGLLQLDIERWNPYTNLTHRQYLIDIIQAFKPFGHKWRVGYYAIAPQRNHIDSLTPWAPSYQAWKDRNTSVASIAEASDVLFPSLYTLYPDKEKWLRFATENILEAKRYNPVKKIVPILWPQYYDWPNDPYALRYIDPEFWYEQLMTVYRYCDDVLVWKGVNREPWNESFPWLGVTREFIARYSNQIWEP